MEENKINRIADNKTAFAHASNILMSHLKESFTNDISPEKVNQVIEQEAKESQTIVLEKGENISDQPDSDHIPTFLKNKEGNDYWNLKNIKSSFYKFFK